MTSIIIAMVGTFGAYMLLLLIAGLAGVAPDKTKVVHAMAAVVAICFGVVLGLWHSGVCS